MQIKSWRNTPTYKQIYSAHMQAHPSKKHSMTWPKITHSKQNTNTKTKGQTQLQTQRHNAKTNKTAKKTFDASKNFDR